MLLRAVVGLASVIGLVCAGGLANAADPGFCRDYSQAALRQVRIAYEHPYCREGARGSRWSRDFREHYEWCLGVSYRAAEREREARRGYLEYCAHR
jgi:hypothetical protein